ncbi:uncharacterized protein [Atheta coriaria]|uniref:uncharacterized protein isoform X4 n=1 Tax=Dalotia coriaria TaxID=877792 RepID=UPI0031F3D5BD
MSKDNIFFSKFERTQSRGATVLSPNSLSRRTQCRKTTVFSLNSGERNVVGQLFFHQIETYKNAVFVFFGRLILWFLVFSGRTQCRKTTVFSPSCSRLILWFLLFSGQSHCRGATVLSPNSGERNVVGQPFLH